MPHAAHPASQQPVDRAREAEAPARGSHLNPRQDLKPPGGDQAVTREDKMTPRQEESIEEGELEDGEVEEEAPESKANGWDHYDHRCDTLSLEI